jgi:hypothetical protein
MAAALASGERVFIGGGMILFDYVAFPISRLVTAEVVVRLISAPR